MSITPDILTNKGYLIDFVPVMKTADRYSIQEKFLEGLYVVRIKVRQGNRQELYSYREGDEDFFTVRNKGRMLRVEGREMLKLGKARM